MNMMAERAVRRNARCRPAHRGRRACGRRAASAPTFTARRCSPAPILDGESGARLFFKAENLQKVGAFKMRGAINFVLQLTRRGGAARRGDPLVGQPRSGGGGGGARPRRAGHGGDAAQLCAGQARVGGRLRGTRGAVRRRRRGARRRGRAVRGRAGRHADPSLRPPAHRRRPGHAGAGAVRAGRGAGRRWWRRWAAAAA